MKTSDYSKFSFIFANRDINQTKVEDLKESMTKMGVLEAKPIMVNEKYQILDGQHRFIACKELGMPFHYIVQKKIKGISDYDLIIDTNRIQKGWTLVEYVSHHAKLKVPFHKYVQEFQDQYKLGMSNSLVICTGTKPEGEQVRKGVDIKIFEKAHKVADFIFKCKDLHFYKNLKFVAAVTALHKHMKPADIERVVKRHSSIAQQASVSQYQSVFCNIINKYKPTDQHVSF